MARTWWRPPYFDPERGLCPPHDRTAGADGDLGQLARARACAARAVTEAVTGVNAPAVTRVYEVKTGVAPVTRIAAIG